MFLNTQTVLVHFLDEGKCSKIYIGNDIQQFQDSGCLSGRKEAKNGSRALILAVMFYFFRKRKDLKHIWKMSTSV